MTASDPADAELHEQALAGDRQALDELRARIQSHLYDLALRISIDPAVAADATRAAFDRLISSGRPQGISFYAWALATVRDETLERVRTRAGAADETRAALSPVDASFSRTAGDGDEELNAWVWQAARSQRPRDYSLLDLAIRRGLSADEIADATDMSHSGIYAILGRLRGLFEESFTSSLLYHRGREACAEIAALVEQHPSLGPSLRREIARHAEGCGACRQTRRSFPPPAALLAAFELVPAPQGLWDTPTPQAEPAASPQAALPLAVAGVPASGGNGSSGGDEEASPTPLSPADGGDAGRAATLEAGDGRIGEDAPEAEPQVAAVSGLVSASDADVNLAAGDTPLARLAVETAAGEESSVAEGGTEPAETTAPRRPGRRAPDTAAASQAAVQEERLRFGRDPYLAGMGSGSGLPPRRPWDRLRDWFQEQGPARISLTVLFGAALIAAVYLGLALGASIEGGSGGSAGGGLAALPTTTPGVRQIGCGTGRYNLDRGNSYTLTFEASALPGFQISKVGVVPRSEGAIARALEAKASAALTLEVVALATSGSGRDDEYVIDVTFSKPGERDIVSQCTVFVRAPAATPTPQPSPTAAPPTSTPSPTPRPVSTQPPPPTQPPAPTPIPVTPSPTYNPTIPTWTPSPLPTHTPTPTRTPTPIL